MTSIVDIILNSANNKRKHYHVFSQIVYYCINIMQNDSSAQCRFFRKADNKIVYYSIYFSFMLIIILEVLIKIFI